MDAARGGGGGGYPDSLDSSPRSRAGDSCDDPFQPKLRLMCSYGGQIVPRPHDKSLCYLGGDTRIVVVERHTTLAELSGKLLALFSGSDFSLKYQLPSEDLDSLISITTEEDFDNMVEEYDRIAASCSHGTAATVTNANKINTSKPSRLRLFLFPVKTDSAPSSIGSLLDDSKSETWFVDALNGAIGMGAALPRGSSGDSIASSVNCLLSLGEDTIPSVPAMPVEQRVGEQNHHHVQPLKHTQEIHSVPDSPMMDTSSSFGSTSSAPSQLNLPQIRSDDRSPDKRGLEEHFSQMTVAVPVAVHVPLPSSAATSVAPATGCSPHENHNHGGGKGGFSSDDDNLDQLMMANRPQPPLPQQLKLNGAFDMSISARPVYYPENTSHVALHTWNNALNDPKQEVPQASDSKYMVQSQVSEQSSHVWPKQQQQHLQYIHANPQLVQHHHPSYPNPQLLPHHHPSTPLVPIQSYYQIHHPIHHQQQSPQTHPYISQVPVYFMPVPQNSPYSLSMQQQPPNLADGTIMSSSSSSSSSSGKPVISGPNNPIPLPRGVASPQKHPELPTASTSNIYRTNSTTSPQPSPPPQLVNMNEQTHQFIPNYPPMHHHPSSQSAPTPSAYGYEFSNQVHTQQPVYYAQTASSPLPSQFHMTSSASATIMSDAQIQSQKPDLKQTRAAS